QREQQLEVAAAVAPEPEADAGRDDLRTDRDEVLARELLRGERREPSRELDDKRLLDPGVRKQLEPALERREQLHSAPEHRARVGVERDDGRAPTRRERGAEHRTVPDVDAVERADRHRARHPLELGRRPRDVHAALPSPRSSSASTPARTTGSTRASAASGSRSRAAAAGISDASSTSEASSTRNGPTAVRRSVVQ